MASARPIPSSPADYETLSTLGTTAGTLLLRARSRRDGELVLLKQLDEPSPDASEVAALRAEHARFEALNSESIPRPLAFLATTPHAIVLADPGGALLDAALGKPLPLALTLAVARDLADGLAA
ncbi:MAG: hypothetical protein KC731_28645, partial [Myxococcales bacterium]|nr:hypothetical protein [Myxococcales bacterium]